MPITLISQGAVSQGSLGGALTPAWATGSVRAPGNLLICLAVVTRNNALGSAPAGWTADISSTRTFTAAAVYRRIATGADAAPTLPAPSGAVWSAMLLEFTGHDQGSPLDQSGFAGGASPQAATFGARDAAPGELVMIAAGAPFGTPAATTVTWTWTRPASGLTLDNGATSTSDHYAFGWGFTTDNVAADKVGIGFSGSPNEMLIMAASYKVGAADSSPGTLNPAGRLPGLY